ncbi:MAG: calcium-binding protein [Paracoccaceae bacterium]|nr:calcium-binding protein [Paracoccaceae bacterium]
MTTLTGTGFVLTASGEPTAGTITSISFSDGSTVQGTITDINWGLVDFNDALAAAETGDRGPMAALFDSAAPVTIDASGAQGGYNLEGSLENILELMTGPVNVTGSPFGDELTGTSGNDTLSPGSNNFDFDEIEATTGSDTYDFSGVSPETFASLDYENIFSPLTFNIDDDANTGTIQGPGFTDTITDVARIMQADGLGVQGSESGDTFNIAVGEGSWLGLSGLEGNDTYNITLNGGAVRLDFRRGGDTDATAGLVANLATGVVSNDGLGFTDQINVSGTDGRVEIRATDMADSIIGSDRDDRFILEQGDDTVNGGAGSDTVRYDRSGVGPVDVDLAAQTASGTWDGFAFLDTLINIENVRGSRNDNDTLRGNAADNELEGFGGNDLIVGRNGNDRLQGDEGNDTLRGDNGDDNLRGDEGNDRLFGGNGRDTLYGGNGNDRLDASGGSAESQGFGDYIRPGLGNDTILGHAALFADDEGADISYADLSGVGGITINADVNGSGTAVSGNGQSNDTFTFIHYFEGSQDDDDITGSNGSHYEGYAGLAGNDTIDGRDGIDRVDYSYEEGYGGGAVGINGNLATGQITDTFGHTDTVTNVEQVRGTQYNDFVTAAGVAFGVRLIGEQGDDTLIGGGNNDRLEGDEGADRLVGNNGDDFLNGGIGTDSDTLIGGNGSDTLYGNAGGDVLNGGNGFDFADYDIDEAVVADLVNPGVNTSDAAGDTYNSIEGILGGKMADDLRGNAVGNLLIGNDGNDTLTGRNGNDTLNGGAGADVLNGGNQNDVANGGNGRDLANLGNGNDVFNDVAQGGVLGRDTVNGGNGNDTINGGGGNDLFNGGNGNDVIRGGNGNDTLNGNAGADTLNGGNNNDVVNGGNGRDLANLGNGNDVFNDVAQGGVLGRDTVNGGNGNDTINGGGGNDLFNSGNGNDEIRGGNGNDTLNGNGGNDLISGGNNNDLANGGLGADRLFGGNGNDTLNGNQGNDRLSGGNGNDQLTGGLGVDTFVFEGTTIAEDVITDFTSGTDILALDDALWGGGLTEAQVISQFGAVTAQGVLLDFQNGNTILLEGLTSTTGLDNDLTII